MPKVSPPFYRYLITHPDTPDFICESPCPGAAVEFWLACHGMLGYNEPPSVTLTDREPDETEQTFRKIMDPPKDWLGLDKHHTWKENNAQN